MEIPRHWRIKKQRLGLVGEVCPHCDAKLFPPRDVCPECSQLVHGLIRIAVSESEIKTENQPVPAY